MMNRSIISLILIMFFSRKTELLKIEYYVLEQEVYLSSNESFEYSLGTGISIEGGFSIEKQARHFEVSDLVINRTGLLQLEYVYKPKAGFKGIDIVVLKNCISIGSGNCDKIELFKFTFHIK